MKEIEYLKLVKDELGPFRAQGIGFVACIWRLVACAPLALAFMVDKTLINYLCLVFVERLIEGLEDD